MHRAAFGRWPRWLVTTRFCCRPEAALFGAGWFTTQAGCYPTAKSRVYTANITKGMISGRFYSGFDDILVKTRENFIKIQSKSIKNVLKLQRKDPGYLAMGDLYVNDIAKVRGHCNAIF